MNKKLKTTVTGACLGLVLAGGSVFAAASPGLAATSDAQPAKVASAKLGIEPPGAGEIIGVGKEILDAIALCDANQQAGLPCTQGTDETVTQIYAMLRDFTQRYEKDQERTQESFDEVIRMQHDAAVKSEYNMVRNDLETTYVGLQLLQSYGDCAMKYTSGEGGSCMKVNRFGVTEDEGQPATRETLTEIQAMIVANDDGDDGSPGFRGQDAPSFVQHIGGKNATNPYAQTMEGGLLPALINQAQAAEAHDQGVTPGTHLNFFRSEYVNHTGELTESITSLEEGYFTARIAAAQMKGQTNNARALSGLATDGRKGGSPVLSIKEQRKAFEFPGWTPENKLADNQSYFLGKKGGAVLLTNDGATKGQPAADAQNLPTPKQLSDFGSDFGANYVRYQKLFPAQLPDAPGQNYGNPNAATRLWSAPQPTWQANLQASDDRYAGGCIDSHRVGQTLASIKAACGLQSTTSVTMVGDQLSAITKKGQLKVAVPADQITMRPISYSVYPSPTNTQKGWGDDGHSGQTRITLPTTMSAFADSLGGPKVTALNERPGAVSADPTWAAFTHLTFHSNQMGSGGGGSVDDHDSHGVGVTINTDTTAGTLEFQPVTPGGLLQ